MKEFIDKLISMLEERLHFYENRFAEMGGTDRDVEDWGSIKSYKDAIRIINELAEEYKGGWIPCSERLPSVPAPMLVTIYTDCDDYACVVAYYLEEKGWVDAYTTEMINEEVIAWQMQPPLYRGGK